MAPPFKKMSRDEFARAVAQHNWKPKKSEIHVHCTWQPDHAQYNGLHSINGMYKYHTGKGWSDIAQHISIAPDGSIWTGRPWNNVPASALGYNRDYVFMFETIGNFDSGKDPLQGEQLESVLFVVATLQIWFGLPSWSSIRFHNQMTNIKTCPGTSVDRATFIEQVKKVRDRLEQDQSKLFGTGIVSESVLSAIGGDGLQAEGVVVDEGEHDHGPELEAFMLDYHANPFNGTLSPSAEGASSESNSANEVLNAIKSLTPDQSDVEALFAELGRRTQLIEADPSQAGIYQPEIALVAEGYWDSFAEFGKKLFIRVETGMHALLCGDSAEDASDRAKLREALGLGEDAVKISIVGVLTSSFGVAPALAVVLTALLIKLVFRPTYEETCALWSTRIGRA